MTTTLSGVFGGAASFFWGRLFEKKWDLSRMTVICNGILGGLVSITGPCAVVHPWAAVLIGIPRILIS